MGKLKVSPSKKFQKYHGAVWLRSKEKNNARNDVILVRSRKKEICCVQSSVWIQGAREEEGLLKFCLLLDKVPLDK